MNSTRRASRFALVGAAALTACGTGSPASVPLPGPAVTLAVVAAAQPLPGADRSTTITMSPKDGAWVDGRPTVLFHELRDALRARAAALPHEQDGSSFLEVVVRADEDTPFTAVQWAMQAAADEKVQASRIRFAVEHRPTGQTGALEITLPKDTCGGDGVRRSPAVVLSLVVADDGTAASPEAVYAAVKRQREKDPAIRVEFAFGKPTPDGSRVRHGAVMRMLDAVQRAGVTRVRFMGAATPKWKQSVAASDDWDLRAAIAELAARPRGVVVARIGGVTVGADAESEPIPYGLSPSQIAAGRGPVPPLPPMPKALARGAPATGMKPADAPAEEVLPPTPEEVEQIHATDVVAKEPTIKDADLPMEPEEAELPEEEETEPVEQFEPPSAPAPAPTPAPRRTPAPNETVDRALQWLAAHQSADGGWEAAGFSTWCDRQKLEHDRRDGSGKAEHDVGVTGLALLAFLGAGYSQRSEGPYGKVVAEGLRYLRNLQDGEGCFARRSAGSYVYSHAIATMAIVDAYRLTRQSLLRDSAQKALDFAAYARNPAGVWRYGVKPGDNDTSVTGWMLLAFERAMRVNLEDRKVRPETFVVDMDAFDGIRAWIDKATDPATGRVGYQQRGEGPARPAERVSAFPPEKSEAMTAVGVLSRIFLGEDPTTSDAIHKGVALLDRQPPAWNAKDGSIDFVYWHFGTLAMARVGGESWKAWQGAFRAAVEDRQRKDTELCALKGSWDPIDAWGADGGRVYSTALLALCCEALDRK